MGEKRGNEDFFSGIETQIKLKGFYFVDSDTFSELDSSDDAVRQFKDDLYSDNTITIYINGKCYKLQKESYASKEGDCLNYVWFISDENTSLIPVKGLLEFLESVMKYKGENGNRYFRGQKASYDLLPSLFRNKEWIRKEMELNARVYNDRPQDFLDCHSTFDKLVRLKHFDQPSRLLDVTANPLVALFFACFTAAKDKDDSVGVVLEAFCNPKDEKISVSSDTVVMLTAMTNTKIHGSVEQSDGVIMCYKNKESNDKPIAPKANGESCYKKCLEKHEGNANKLHSTKRKKLSNSEWAFRYIEELSHQCKKEGMPIYWDDVCYCELNQSILVKPPLNTDRIVRQGGCFIMCGMNPSNIYSPPGSLYDFFKPGKGKRNVYYVLPGENKKTILAQLKLLGIDEYFIFPELEKEIRVVSSSVCQ